MPLHDAYMCIGIATSNKKLLGAPGIATRSMPMRHRVDRLERSLASSCPELDVGNTSGVCVCRTRCVAAYCVRHAKVVVLPVQVWRVDLNARPCVADRTAVWKAGHLLNVCWRAQMRKDCW